MKVTKQGNKGRKLHKEGYPQKVVAEQRGYVEVLAHVWDAMLLLWGYTMKRNGACHQCELKRPQSMARYR